jgi:SAM-dependent methyltransferase
MADRPRLAAVEATESLHDIYCRILEADLSEYDPWLYRYCGDLASKSEAMRYYTHLVGLLEFGRVAPRGTVLDAGCGFGFTLLALRWLGASDAYGLDISTPMIGTVRAYLPLFPNDFSAGIHVTEGSVTEMPYEDASFDLVLSQEAISHYRDEGALLCEV